MFPYVYNTNNTRAEFLAILDLMEHLDDENKYIIYTDCEGIIKCLNKKKKN